MSDQTTKASNPHPVRDACGRCAGFATLLAAAAAGWATVMLVCSRMMNL